MALIFMPAPTDTNTTWSPFFKQWLLSFPFLNKSYRVGRVATELFPNQDMVIGMTFSGISWISYSLLYKRFKIALSIFSFA